MRSEQKYLWAMILTTNLYDLLYNILYNSIEKNCRGLQWSNVFENMYILN